MRETSRRELLFTAGSLGALAALARAQDPAKAQEHAGPIDRPKSQPCWKLSLGEWALHRTIQKGELDHLDFARAAKRDFGFEGVDYVSTFFADKVREAGYIAEMRKRASGEGVQSLCILVDGEGDLADEDKAQRARAVDGHQKWLDAARELGCSSIRVNLSGAGSRSEKQDAALESLEALGLLAASPICFVLVENHGGLSSDGSWLAEVIGKGKSSTPAFALVGTLPDFGNWTIDAETKYDRYRGVAELMPFAKNVSAKSHDFDAQGDETSTDYRKMLKIVADAGYRGWLEVEYEGERLSERDGIRATKKLIETVCAELAAGR